TIPTSHFFSELYRAKGKPKISMLVQAIYLCFLIPTIAIASQYGFTVLAITTTADIFLFALIHFIVVRVYFKLGIATMLKNIASVFLAASGMAAVSFLLKQVSQDIGFQLVSIVICVVFYFGLLLAVKPFRETLKNSELTAGLYAKISRALQKRQTRE
ncbi:MAG: hypothetical protein IH607_06600, partial [Firmicutes bacterium]|nr:hypothetical protein [Bacillota bacterium]